jgi:hypothetical protein
MRSKQWRTLGVVLAVLIVVYLITWVRDSKHTTSTDRVFDIDQEELSRFVIREGEQWVEVTRGDTAWVLTGHEDRKLRQWRIDSFFNTVLPVERESMISSNPDKWGEFGVDSTGRFLEIYDQKDRLAGNVVVGRSATTWQSSYIREAGDNEVYMTRGSIYHLLSADTTYWLEPLPQPEEEEAGSEESFVPAPEVGTNGE